jgi:alkaline phosphatase D
MHYIRIIFIIISFIFCSSNNEDYVILVSFDGFRYDYADRLDTPHFDYIEHNGVKAKSLKPVFPSFTFPNHYSIATGCYADKHGISGNEFSTYLDSNIISKYSYKDKSTVQDSKWYKAEPIWVTAERNGIISATYFWVGSEAEIGGYYPTYYKKYQSGIDPISKVDQVVNWLKLPIKDRPRLVCLYFNEPDHAGHVYGASSKEVNEQIKKSDEVLGYLIESLEKLSIYNQINVVVVSDHGMVDVSKDKMINIDNFNIRGVIDGKGPVMSVIDADYENDYSNIPNVQIVPSKNNSILHYDNPLYDYLLIADEGWLMYKTKDFINYNKSLPVKGMHGYNADSINMHAIFYAFGPMLKSGLSIDTFELIHIYPLLCNLLKIDPYHDIDGNFEVLKPILN